MNPQSLLPKEGMTPPPQDERVSLFDGMERWNGMVEWNGME